MIRNIDKMYYNYGYKDGHFCHECPHFRKACWNKKSNKRLLDTNRTARKLLNVKALLRVVCLTNRSRMIRQNCRDS